MRAEPAGSVEPVEFLVEEPSMETFLHGLLPRILGPVTFSIHASQSKSELLKNLPARLRGYRGWLPPTWRIVVLIDRDAEDCHGLKSQLENEARAAGLPTRSRPSPRRAYSLVNRIAVEELEAWYFGDWRAVCEAFPRVASSIPDRKAYRKPDEVRGGTWEALERILQRAGYFENGLRKIEAARKVARHIDPARNRSPSFMALYAVLCELAER